MVTPGRIRPRPAPSVGAGPLAGAASIRSAPCPSQGAIGSPSRPQRVDFRITSSQALSVHRSTAAGRVRTSACARPRTVAGSLPVPPSLGISSPPSPGTRVGTSLQPGRLGEPARGSRESIVARGPPGTPPARAGRWAGSGPRVAPLRSRGPLPGYGSHVIDGDRARPGGELERGYGPPWRAVNVDPAPPVVPVVPVRPLATLHSDLAIAQVALVPTTTRRDFARLIPT